LCLAFARKKFETDRVGHRNGHGHFKRWDGRALARTQAVFLLYQHPPIRSQGPCFWIVIETMLANYIHCRLHFLGPSVPKRGVSSMRCDVLRTQTSTAAVRSSWRRPGHCIQPRETVSEYTLLPFTLTP
jgi:hypothetical protein